MFMNLAILVKNTELHSDLITGLEFILNAANRFPEIFFPPLLAHSDDQENDANEEWQKMLKTTPYGIQKLNFVSFFAAYIGAVLYLSALYVVVV